MALKPSPFNGNTDLEEIDGQIVCSSTGERGPKATADKTAEDLWNERVEAEDEPEEQPPADDSDTTATEDEKAPEAAAGRLATLATARTAHSAQLTTTANLRAMLRASRQALAAMTKDATTARGTARQAIADRDTAKAALKQMAARAEKAEAYEKADVQRVNAEVQRVVASAGHGPLKTNPANGPTSTKETITVAELREMAPAARTAFFRNGGQLSD